MSLSKTFTRAGTIARTARDLFNSKLQRLAAQGRKPEESETAPGLHRFAIDAARQRKWLCWANGPTLTARVFGGSHEAHRQCNVYARDQIPAGNMMHIRATYLGGSLCDSQGHHIAGAAGAWAECGIGARHDRASTSSTQRAHSRGPAATRTSRASSRSRGHGISCP